MPNSNSNSDFDLGLGPNTDVDEETRYEISNEELAEVNNIFTFHPSTGDQVERYQRIQEAAMELWVETLTLTPGSPEQTLARRALELFVFWSNASIARNE